MKKKIIIEKSKIKKGGYVGNGIWNAHRLEGVVKNKAIKPTKKKKRSVVKKPILGKIYNPNKFSKKLVTKTVIR